MLPAAGTGGGVVSRLLNRDATADASGRPTKSRSSVPNVNTYSRFVSSADAGRNVSVVPLNDHTSEPVIGVLPGPVNRTPAAAALASIGRENCATIAVP